MSHAPRVQLSPSQRETLERWSRGGSTPFRVVVRSQIVLLASQGYSNRNIARLLRLNPLTVARWRSRFLLLGVDGICHEAPRMGSPPPVSDKLVQTILNRTRYEQPPGQSRWSTRSLARAVGVSHSTVRRIWKAYHVRPPASRVARLARKPKVARKSMDVVGVYVNPPSRAVAISFLDQDGVGPRPAEDHTLPALREGPGGRRPWMTDLVTSLNLLDSSELKGSARRLLDQEFLSFLHSVLERRHGREQIHLWAATDSTEVPPSLSRFLHRHPEFSARVEQGNAPLRDTVVEWIGDVAVRESTVGSPASLPLLQTAVERWAREAADGPRPFAWTRASREPPARPEPNPRT